MLAQGIAGPASLALAVCLHGAAADALVACGEGPLGLTAGELPIVARRLLNAAAGTHRAAAGDRSATQYD
jgi:hypothetical protein